ncbi:molybdate transport system regulatory protein [Rhodobium orientis]|uniref:Mop domain-containing protein n=1 Tax=Rhodobium orientis TaxID=34017 RepID=A0A327JIA0_9HYPH|nr:TOBE domain-containing protein [Rhodobium orientis]MBB4304401.1 molybdate transport system regulatory protein [Rhodobium orientis]MBK5952007.1 hypothetical protein [Rhodobium orientis]RAI25785.1 hypothetical protein CH339_16900 [Rhodobium orientis]
MTTDTNVLTPVLSFLDAEGHRAGEDRFRLIDAIDRLGSISAAARDQGLSYKGAWDAVNALNNLFSKPLVVARPGGRHGGGAEVTREGRRAIAAHKLLTERLGTVLADLDAALSGTADGGLSPLLWSFAMKTSARNTYYGIVSHVQAGAVNSEISLDISEETTLTAIITNQSAISLGIHPGREVFALIKASTPILMRADETARTSARNRICGTVAAVTPGAVNTEVVIDIGAGKTLVAIVTKASAEDLEFQPGERACALIKASHIILGVD